MSEVMAGMEVGELMQGPCGVIGSVKAPEVPADMQAGVETLTGGPIAAANETYACNAFNTATQNTQPKMTMESVGRDTGSPEVAAASETFSLSG